MVPVVLVVAEVEIAPVDLVVVEGCHIEFVLDDLVAVQVVRFAPVGSGILDGASDHDGMVVDFGYPVEH